MSRVVLIVCVLCFPLTINAQKKPTIAKSSLCTKENAVDTTKQQILLTRTFDNQVQRVAVLIRAADLLWPHDQEKALAAFMEAFDVAAQNFKENGDQVTRTSQSQFAARIALPDQRFKVISALAKRDPARARKLSAQMLEDDAREVADKPATDDQAKRRTAEKLLITANGLLETDPPNAVNFARESLRYPAVLQLAVFLYELAKSSRQLADKFYVEAMNAYAAAPMDQFLYLSAYPFGNTRDAGQMPGYTSYKIPDGFVPDRGLQKLFIQTLLSRIEGAMQTPVPEAPTYRYTDHAQMWMALSRLERQVQSELPELSESVTQSKDKLFALLNPSAQKNVTGVISNDNAPKKSFEERVEAAEKMSDVARRDQELSFAVTSASNDQTLDRVLSVIDKISDADVRASLSNWFYYFRAQSLIEKKNLADARTSANHVSDLDKRAYLFTRIAEESLKVAEDQTEAREALNEVAEAISKAPKTIVTARALLALAHLYAKFDMNRGITELANAVRTINAIESPDFSQQFVMMKIEGRTFGSFASIQTPGFNPENAFREMGKLDFDGSLTQAATFTDKSLRALTTLAVIEPCFEPQKGTKNTKKN